MHGKNPHLFDFWADPVAHLLLLKSPMVNRSISQTFQFYFKQELTCDKFLKGLPSCVEFDLKLLFYYNFRRHIESTVDFNDFRCIRLQLFPLKTGLYQS